MLYVLDRDDNFMNNLPSLLRGRMSDIELSNNCRKQDKPEGANNMRTSKLFGLALAMTILAIVAVACAADEAAAPAAAPSVASSPMAAQRSVPPRRSKGGALDH